MPIIVRSKGLLKNPNGDNFTDLKFHIGGGIGDSLKEMTINLPLQDYCNKTGHKIYVAYGGSKYNDCGWNDLLKQNIGDKSDSFIWITDDEYNKSELPEARSFFGRRGHHPFQRELPLKLNGDNIQIDKSKYNVVMQLQGNDMGKRWEHEKYGEVCKYLLNKNPNTNIYIIDRPEVKIDKKHINDDRIINLIGRTSLFQNINLLGDADLFLGPDSYTKYVCQCYRTKQIILMLDVGYMQPKQMLKLCFHGLTHNKNVNLVGIDYDNELNVTRINKDVKKIEVQEVLNAIF
jgi:hypothetical protein